MPSDADAKKVLEASKWNSIGMKISDFPNPSYHHPTKTDFDHNTGGYKAHPTYGNDKAARGREKEMIAGRDIAYSADDPRHTDSKCHGPRINDEAARDREKNNVAGRDFGYSEANARHTNSKVGI